MIKGGTCKSVKPLRFAHTDEAYPGEIDLVFSRVLNW
jgi:hypothetical protein